MVWHKYFVKLLVLAYTVSCEIGLFSDPNPLTGAICPGNIKIYCLANSYSSNTIKWFISDSLMVYVAKSLSSNDRSLPIILDTRWPLPAISITLNNFTSTRYLESTLEVALSYLKLNPHIFLHYPLTFRCGDMPYYSNPITLKFTFKIPEVAIPDKLPTYSYQLNSVNVFWRQQTANECSNDFVYHVLLIDGSKNVEEQKMIRSGDCINSKCFTIIQRRSKALPLLENYTVDIKSGYDFGYFNNEILKYSDILNPQVLTELNASANGNRSLLISWHFSNWYSKMDSNFTLIITKLKVSTVVSGIQEPYYIFSVEEYLLCDAYNFQVIAENAFGDSNSSKSITSYLPFLPPLPVMNSLKHSFVKRAKGEISIRVEFNTTLRCPPLGIESDMTTYILVMKDSEGNKYESTPVTQGYGIAAFETLLLEDTTYSYYILASNVFGTNTSPTVNIGTTDVEMVTINKIGENTYSVQCHYIQGSDALGCVYVLVSEVEEFFKNMSGTLLRRSESEGGDTILKVFKVIGCYQEVLVYDLESNHHLGNLLIRVKINLNERCPIEELVKYTPPSSFDVPFSAQVLLALLYLPIIVIIALLVYFYIKDYKDAIATNTAQNSSKSGGEEND